MDTLYIKDLNACTTIGVHEHERGIKQELKINLKIGFNNHTAASTDDLSNALDYEAISKRTLEYVESSQHFLIETVAENLSQLLLKEFSIEQLTLTISKPGAIEAARNVGVKIKRP